MKSNRFDIKSLDIFFYIASMVALFFFIEISWGFFIDSKDGLSKFLNLSVKLIQNWIYFILAISLFFKFRFSYLAYVFPLALFEQVENVFASVGHDVLLNTGVYDLFSKNPLAISPEYPRIIFFMIILVVFFIALFFKKFRNFKRIFLFMSGFSIFTTAVLFHTMIIKEVDFYRMNTKNIMGYVLNEVREESEIKRICSANKFECHLFSLNNQAEIFSSEDIDYSVRRILENMKPFFLSEKRYKHYGVAHASMGDRLTGQIPFFLLKTDSWAMVVVDKVNHREFLALNQFIFGYLAFASHFIWFFGALFLIWFHERKFKKSLLKY